MTPNPCNLQHRQYNCLENGQPTPRPHYQFFTWVKKKNIASQQVVVNSFCWLLVQINSIACSPPKKAPMHQTKWPWSQIPPRHLRVFFHLCRNDLFTKFGRILERHASQRMWWFSVILKLHIRESTNTQRFLNYEWNCFRVAKFCFPCKNWMSGQQKNM